MHWIALPMIGAACSSPAATVQLAPIDYGSSCGKPVTSSAIRVIAYAPSGDVKRSDTEITDFPADTTQLGVEVLGGSEVLSTGKSVPLAFNDLANQTKIPIAMAPLDGFCALSGMNVVRARPLVAHAGTGVLVMGGDQPDPDMTTHSTAEFYDPATATFTPIKVPSVIDGNHRVFANGAVAELADGRVVVSGDDVLTTFDPETMTFSEPSAIAIRDQHAAIGIDANHMLVSGGCVPNSPTCDAGAVTLRTSFLFEIGSDGKLSGDPTAEPTLALPASSVRYGGHLFDLGVTSDGKRRLVLAGAPSDPTTGDALPYADDPNPTSTVQHMFSQVAALDGGALLTALDPDGTANSPGPAAIVAPEGPITDGVDVALAGAITGARLVTLEDGTVAAIGGQPGISRYIPTTNRWISILEDDVANSPGAITGPSLIRLADGSVLVLPGSEPSAHAWLYRPSLVGPNESDVTGAPDGTDGVLTTPAFSTAMRTSPTLTLTAPGDDLTARALVGGPRRMYGTLTASVTKVMGGGVALIAQQTGPARMLVARLVPGEPARIERHEGATITTICSGSMVGDITQPLGLSVTADGVTASINSTAVVHCDATMDTAAPERGSWGIAATANGTLSVVTITVGR